MVVVFLLSFERHDIDVVVRCCAYRYRQIDVQGMHRASALPEESLPARTRKPLTALHAWTETMDGWEIACHMHESRSISLMQNRAVSLIRTRFEQSNAATVHPHSPPVFGLGIFFCIFDH